MSRNEVSAQKILEATIAAILESGDSLVIDGSYWAEIGDLVSHDSLEARSPENLAFDYAGLGKRVLDFGCGTAGFRPFLEGLGYDWTGVNYREGMADNAAATAETLNDHKMFFYGGTILPFPDASFDVVFSFQVFEHIQDIRITFAEIARVLKPGGRLIGAVSYMEQIHDYSTFNFTPYGLKLASRDAGLMLEKVYPRSDAFSFLLRRLLVVTSASDENSLTHHINANNSIHDMMADYALKRADIKSANLFRLMFCTHFAFDVLRP
ncbi:hypothetical protein ASD52_04735 [Ensifer sp. Root142]|uniref:class I SAM-dependent methyltransferase n=1 Tax=Ensifer sp. Root142 TaxID=1736461 RepID=UPI000709D78A|nr:class I SAM-dependent methyltransferase [Ensifer sp. Root142]KQY79121.1 hypothetical protein ASD52_04735 [Ensifer sp. Root142]